MNAKTAALLVGTIFIIVGILGFVQNPLVGENAIFHTDGLHNGVHIGSGVLFIIAAVAGASASRSFLIIFGLVYLALGILGLIQFGTSGMGKLLGILHVNGNDNLLHVGLGVVILLLGVTSKRYINT